MHQSPFRGEGGEFQAFVQVFSQGPLAEDVLPGLECRCDQISMFRNLDDDTYEVDIRMPRQLAPVRERQPSPASLRGFARRFLVSSGNRNDLNTRDRLERRDMRS
jgi:hypothetical protein